MFRRKYQRKSGLTRTLVALLALVMLASVCFPAMRVSAVEEEPVQTEQPQSNDPQTLTEPEAEEQQSLGDPTVIVGDSTETEIQDDTQDAITIVASEQVDVEEQITTFAFRPTEGNGSHIEIEVYPAEDVTVNIDGKTYTMKIGFVTQDQYDRLSAYEKSQRQYIVVNKDSFEITATKGGKPFTDFSSGTFGNGNGSTKTSLTVKYGVNNSGRFPTGTVSDPVTYIITTKNIKIQVPGFDTPIPVTLSKKITYWETDNHCPGATSKSQGIFAGNMSGIDVALSATEIGNAITKGKLGLEKIVVDENGDAITDSGVAFEFTVQHWSDGSGFTKGQYAAFTNNVYSGPSDNQSAVSVQAGQTVILTDLPVGTYRITELQQSGYIVTDAEGNATNDYTKDYTIESKGDDKIPIVSFTNKKLTNQAGISIQKTADGLAANLNYPNPTVTIYTYKDGIKGESVWSGELTANGDRLYLSATLPAGTYLIEETGHTVTGYNCDTTLAGAQEINGLIFSVTGGSRYDLTVHNAYTAIPPESEDTVYIQVQKTFIGLTDAQINALKDSFTITVTDEDGNEYTLKLTDSGVVQNGTTFTWNLSGLNSGTYTVSESGETVEDYDVDTAGTGEITTAESQIVFTRIDDETSCAGKEINVGTVDFVIVKLTDGYFIWTQNTLSANKRSACMEFISNNKNQGGLGYNPEATADNCHFFSGDKLTDEDGLYFREGIVRYDKTNGTLYFDASKQWTMCVWGTYTVTDNDAEVSITNTYTPSTTSVTITKEVKGNMGDPNKSFTFTVTLTGGTMKDGTYDAAGGSVAYTVSENGTKVSFSLADGQKVVLKDVPLNAILTVTETNVDAYSVTINGGTPVKAQGAVGSAEKGNITVTKDLTIAVINENDANIDTGITMDSVPYVLLLAMAVIGGGVLLSKRRVY